MLPTTPESDYQDAIEPFLEIRPRIETVIITPLERIRHAVRFVKAGASDYVISPVDAEEVKFVVDSIYENRLKKHELDYLRDKYWKPEALEFIQTKNQKMAAVFNKIRAVAPTKSSVLLAGETGTGKSLIARLIHQHSNRNNKPFISVHCGAIPDTLIESEFFGHEKGA
ncbi:MAG TPA: sigma-54-dependent Fis family transcriptional regulator, partial [Deltaproteobacteria bacterium]|nr:sigma-54-dependent Fis family transcriptional regulator [Deltaproteobacteria bacterium]